MLTLLYVTQSVAFSVDAVLNKIPSGNGVGHEFKDKLVLHQNAVRQNKIPIKQYVIFLAKMAHTHHGNFERHTCRVTYRCLYHDHTSDPTSFYVYGRSFGW